MSSDVSLKKLLTLKNVKGKLLGGFLKIKLFAIISISCFILLLVHEYMTQIYLMLLIYPQPSSYIF